MYQKPPTINVSYAKTQTKEYRKNMLDFMENEGFAQFCENMERYQDFYDMYDGVLTSRELKEMIPGYAGLSEALRTMEVPTYLRHYDFLGALLSQLVGRFIDFKEKFHVIETGQPAENDFLDHKKKEIQTIVTEAIDAAIQQAMAEAGINLNEEREFTNEEEQQQYVQQFEKIKKEATPKLAEAISKFPNFKTIGISWGENILERDGETMNMDEQYKELFKHWLLTGACAKITKVYYDTYKTYSWDSREVFHSKEIGLKYLNRAEYAGRYHFKTPSQVVEEYGHKMNEDQKIKLLSAGTSYTTLFNDFGGLKYSPKEAMKKHFNEKFYVPTVDHFNRELYQKVEDFTGLPMGIRYSADHEAGGYQTENIFMPRQGRTNYHVHNADKIERRFGIRHDLCQVTECYVRVYEKIGWLTYEDDFGTLVREVVTEDILKEFLKERGIKQTLKVSFEEIIKDELEVNTLAWQSIPVYYEGLKINGAYLSDPIYLYFDKMDNQITNISTYEVYNPVSGLITNSTASKVMPYQEIFNLIMNTLRQELETDIGTVFLTDVLNVPSEHAGNGEDLEESVINMRNMARRTKMLLTQTNPDNTSSGQSIFNQYQTVNLSNAQNIQFKLNYADKMKFEGYSQIGITPQQGLEASKYVTEDGIKTSTEVMNYQLADVFDTFNSFVKEDLIQHLNVAHYMQSNNLDRTVFYTNSTNHKVFLDVSKDEKFSMRRIGLTASDDTRKRKEFASLQQMLLNSNTLGGDSLTMIRLGLTDSASELKQIAIEERQIAEERQQIQQQMLMQENQQKAQLDEQAKQAEWERQEISKDKDRANKIDVARVKAIGDASDNNASLDQLQYINTVADMSLKASKLQQEGELKLRELDIKQQELNVKKQQASEGVLTEYARMQHEKDMKQMDSDIATKHLADVN